MFEMRNIKSTAIFQALKMYSIIQKTGKILFKQLPIVQELLGLVYFLSFESNELDRK